MKDRLGVSTAIVTATTRMCFLESDGPGATISADLAFDPADPYAVTIVFHANGRAVRWTFGRELLIQGIHEPAGIGDVQVWPCLSDTGRAVVVLELRSPSGDVLVQASTREVASFVLKMLTAVPLGDEVKAVDVDAELAELL